MIAVCLLCPYLKIGAKNMLKRDFFAKSEGGKGSGIRDSSGIFGVLIHVADFPWEFSILGNSPFPSPLKLRELRGLLFSAPLSSLSFRGEGNGEFPKRENSQGKSAT